MNVLGFIFGVMSLCIGSFTILMTATIISDYKLQTQIKKEYEESKNFKEEK